jgi:hypothetical protein
VDTGREIIDGGFLAAAVIKTDLGVGDAAVEA